MRAAVLLFLAFLLFSGRPFGQLFGQSAVSNSDVAAASPPVSPLAANATTTTFIYNSTATTLPFNLSGLWQDDEGNNISMSEKADYPCSTTTAYSCSQYFVSATYLSDTGCPAAVGQIYTNFVLNSTGGVSPPKNFLELCTRASNPIVADCGQSALWDTSFNATVSENAITGEYLSQYWTWTNSSGTISNCSIQYTYSAPFTLTRVFNVSSPPSSSSSSSPGTGSASSSTLVASGPTTTSTTSAIASSGSSAQKGVGFLLLYVAPVAAVIMVAAIYVLKWRPRQPSRAKG